MKGQLGFAGFGDGSKVLTDRLLLAAIPEATEAAILAENALSWRSQYALNGHPLRSDLLHITLCHIGDYDFLPAHIVERTMEALAKIKMTPFEAVFDRVMSFRGSNAFVLLGSDENPELRTLRLLLYRALKTDGPGCLSGPSFTPHLTLLYDKNLVEKQQVEPVRLKIREFVLVHSLLGQARHIPLARWPLAG